MDRINARLDPQSAADLELIRLRIGAASVSDALKYALQEGAHCLRNESAAEGESARAFMASDYIGCVSGPESLSESYKEHLDEALRAKHGVDR